MRKKDNTVSPDTAPIKKNRKKKILAVTAALLLVAAGAVLYDVVGPGFINHLVTFDCSGGEEIDAVRVKLGRKIELPEPVRQDYTFTVLTVCFKYRNNKQTVFRYHIYSNICEHRNGS